jgi:hypothetical protein
MADAETCVSETITNALWATLTLDEPLPIVPVTAGQPGNASSPRPGTVTLGFLWLDR